MMLAEGPNMAYIPEVILVLHLLILLFLRGGYTTMHVFLQAIVFTEHPLKILVKFHFII